MANSKMPIYSTLKYKSFSKRDTVNANSHTNITIDFGETISNIKGIIINKTSNGAYVMGNVDGWTNTYATIGAYNTHPSSDIEGLFSITVLYE